MTKFSTNFVCVTFILSVGTFQSDLQPSHKCILLDVVHGKVWVKTGSTVVRIVERENTLLSYDSTSDQIDQNLATLSVCLCCSQGVSKLCPTQPFLLNFTA